MQVEPERCPSLDRELFESVWNKLSNPRLADVLADGFMGKRTTSQSALSQQTAMQEQVNSQRSHARLRQTFASALIARIAQWIHRTAENDPADAAQEWPTLCLWLARLRGSEPVSHCPAPNLEDISPEQMVFAIWESLSDEDTTENATSEELLRVLHWLGTSLENDRQIRIPIVGVDGAHRRASIYRIRFEILGPGGQLLEHPSLWNFALSDKYRETIQQAYQAAWPVLDSRPTIRWEIETNDFDPLLPYQGASHGVAVHVACHLLATDQEPDAGVVFSAAVEGDRLGPVTGLAAKAKEAAKRGYRRFGVCEEANGLPRELTHDLLEELRNQGLEVVPLPDLESAIALALPDPLRTAYLAGVSAQHSKVALWGVPNAAGVPAVELNQIFVALRGMELSAAELKANLQLAMWEFEQRHLGGEVLSTEDERLDEWLIQ
ncbi:MAG: hypothetical protein KDA84_26600, partial [Planctomycetaceae bacterium]|nr:hypothetical protein [Planctomycetaceae bacterium]